MSSEESETERPTMKSVVNVTKNAFRKENDDSESDDGRERDWRKRTDHYSSNREEDDDNRRDSDEDNRRRSKKRRRYSPDRDDNREQSDTEQRQDDDEEEEEKRNHRKRRFGDDKPKDVVEEPEPEVELKKPRENRKTIEDLFTKAGGAYIPPSKLRELQANITDKTSPAYQRMSWEALKKSINGLVNKVNISNIGFIVQEILQENIIRGRGILCQSIMRAQVASPTFTHVYAALVSIINTKFPKIGELLLRRLIMQFKKAFKRNDKPVCISSVKFLAHLVNQEVVHELLSLEVLTLLLQTPTGDSCEVAVSFLKEVGQKLTEISPRGINAIFDTLRNILHNSETEKRIQYILEVMFAIRKDGFKEYPTVVEGLDLVEEDDQVTHLIRLGEKVNTEDLLNVFKVDPNFEESEEKYKQIKSDLLGSDDSSDEDESGDESGSGDDEGDAEEEDAKRVEEMEIIDKTETNLVALRRLIYLTIQSSLDYEECAHKMMKLNIKPGQEHEFCLMVLECCSQQRSYEKFFGLLGQRFCLLKKEFMEQYMIIFSEQYENCHQLETNKLRNTAKFFAHLLHSDAISWTILSCISLNEDDTTSSSRIFIKVIFQDLAEYLGMVKLKLRINDPIISSYVEGIFPRDNPRNTRFSINFFTAIGLGGVTEELRAHLKTMPKMLPKAQEQQQEEGGSDSSSSSSSDSSDSSSSSSSSSEDEDSEDERNKRRNKKDQKRRGSERSDKKSSLRRKRSENEDSPLRRSRGDEREPIERSKRHGSNERPRRRDSLTDRSRRREDSSERPSLREREDSRRREDSPERPSRREREDSRRREDSPERPSRREREDSRKRGPPEDRPRKESPEFARRDKRESPDRVRKDRKDSPERFRRDMRESPDRARKDRRESPDRARKERRDSPDRRHEKSPHNGHSRKDSPRIERGGGKSDRNKRRDENSDGRNYHKYSSRHRSISRER